MTLFDWLIVLGVAGALAASISAWLLARKTERLLRRLFAEIGHEQFGEVLADQQERLGQTHEHLRLLGHRLTSLEKTSLTLLSQVGLVRYNPFEDSGGNVSFSLALLNSHGHGAVITSLHSRAGMRLYSKAIQAYESDHTLTEEEKQAIMQAKSFNT